MRCAKSESEIKALEADLKKLDEELDLLAAPNT